MQAVTDYLGITAEDRIASLLPFSFDYGLNQLLCAVGTGACLVVERSPVPARIVRTLARAARSRCWPRCRRSGFSSSTRTRFAPSRSPRCA